MDLGQYHLKQHTVHSGRVSRVPFCSPSTPLPLTFHSPFAPLGNLTIKLENPDTWKLGNSKNQMFSVVLAVFNHFKRFQLFPTASNHFQPFSTVLNHFQPLPPIFSHFQLFSSILNRFQPFSAIFNRLKLF